MKIYTAVSLLIVLFLSASCSSDKEKNNSPKETIKPVVFTAIGDVPYNDWQRDTIVKVIAKHNQISKSEFVIHVGDIKPGQTPCEETIYQEVSNILKEFTIPTFIILGDNEYNDCVDPVQGLAWWNQYFLNFHKKWSFEPVIATQTERPENFSFIKNKVLFIGINIVGSTVHDQNEWTTRLSDDAHWVEENLEIHKDNIEATVVFGHANIVELNPTTFQTFTVPFLAAADSFGKPVLYLQGDGHVYFKNKPWPEQNITRVQIDGGHRALEVTVDPNKTNPFSFNRTYLD